MKPTAASTQKPKINKRPYHHAMLLNPQNRKFHPASRSERLFSWNQRMQSLFTRQAY